MAYDNTPLTQKPMTKHNRYHRRVGTKKRRHAKIKAGIFASHGEPDRLLFGVVILLVVFGLMMIASAGIVYGDTRFGDPYYFFKQQVLGVVIGMIGLFVLQRVDYHVFRRWSFLIFVGTLFLLVLVLIPGIGVDAYGASRWIAIGPLTVQPAEAVKLAMILYISAWCAGKGVAKIRDVHEGFIPFLMIVGGVSFLILMQPDVGTMGMIVLIVMSIFFVAGARISHLLAMLGGGFILLVALIKAAPYRLARFTTFLHPDSDPQGAGYQIKQALIALGSGGVFGVGLGHSRQKALYLPEPVGDSIYAIIGEELGLIGAVVLLLVFLFLLWRLIRIAQRAPDLFGRLIVGGVSVWIIGQALMNIAAITGLMPLTGIPLSFISYGGTSIVFLLVAIGIVLNVSRQARR